MSVRRLVLAGALLLLLLLLLLAGLALPLIALVVQPSPNALLPSSSSPPPSTLRSVTAVSSLPLRAPQPSGRLFFHVVGGGSGDAGEEAHGSRVEGSTFVRLPRGEDGQIALSAAKWSQDESACMPTYVYKTSTCVWCSTLTKACSKGGKLTLRRFVDETTAKHGVPTLKDLGIYDLLQFRPASKRDSQGKPEIDQVHMTCEGLLPVIPVGERGVLSLHSLAGSNNLTSNSSIPFNAKFVQWVTPRTAALPPTTASTATTHTPRVVICTSALYTFTFSARAVRQYLLHYLDTWQVDKVYLYEMGVTGGVLLEDVLRGSGSGRLAELMAQGRIELVDLRDELQRQYGPIAGDIVLFSRRVGRSVQAADCMARARQEHHHAAAHDTWVMHLDWHDLLALGGNNDAGGGGAVYDLVRKHAQDSTRVLRLHSFRATDTSPPSAASMADVERTRQWHVRHELEAGKAAAAFKLDRYLVRVRGSADWGYGAAQFAPCASSSSSTGAQDEDVRTIPTGRYYVRHYACFGEMDDAQCVVVSKEDDDEPKRPVMNWALDFGGKSQLPQLLVNITSSTHYQYASVIHEAEQKAAAAKEAQEARL